MDKKKPKRRHSAAAKVRMLELREKTKPKSRQFERAILRKRANAPVGLKNYIEDNGPGHPPYVPTAADKRFVRDLSAYGMTAPQISHLVYDKYGSHISAESVGRHFAHELAIGTEVKVAYAAGKIWQHVLDGNLSAAMFFVKTRGRWSSQVNLADPNGNPLATPTVQVMFGADESETTGDNDGQLESDD